MVVFAPCGSLLALLVLCLNFREFSDDANPSWARKPSAFPLLRLAPSGRETRRKNAFRVAQYATRQGGFVSCAFAAAGRMLSATPEKSEGVRMSALQPVSGK